VTRAAITVRRAAGDELGRIAAWNAELIRDEGNDDGLSLPEIETRLREWFANEYEACIFEADGVPFGYAIFRELAECTHLRHFFVTPEHRRRGFGRQAFARLRDRFPADKRVLVEVLTWNGAGRAFWKSVGFAERYVGLQLPPSH
jgi:GNAT superfamily N-acetyltransferase